MMHGGRRPKIRTNGQTFFSLHHASSRHHIHIQRIATAAADQQRLVYHLKLHIYILY